MNPVRPRRLSSMDDGHRIVLDHETLRGIDYSGRKLVQFSAAGVTLEACRFDKAKIEDASLGGGTDTSEYIDCSFDGARMRFGPGGFARFVRCSFRQVDIRDWYCFAVELIDCTFTGRLAHSFFNGTVPEEARQITGRERNEFYGNDFAGASLLDVDFRSGIDLTRQKLPTGPEYIYIANADKAVQRARSEVIGWTDLALRQQAMALLQVLARNVAGGQNQLLLRPANYSAIGAAVVHAVLRLLQGDGD